MLTDKELAEKEAGRNLGEELLEAVHQMKRGERTFDANVLLGSLEEGYRAMAADAQREAEVSEWCNALLRDMPVGRDCEQSAWIVAQSLTQTINVSTIIGVTVKYTWVEKKRRSNLEKHGLDFMDADLVLESPYRFEIDVVRNGESRKQTFAYVFDRLLVLTVVYLPGAMPHIISFRPAHRSEREVYHDWLENDFDER